jgi:outer membrane protein OmpA-like peptidoglycan-associated protein
VPSEQAVVPGTSYPFQVSAGDFSINYQENFNFAESDFKIVDPLHQKVTAGVFAIQKFLEGQPNQTLSITGFFDESEDNDSAFPNLGMARANAIKNFMVGKGIPVGQLAINGMAKNEMEPTEGIYLGPCAFTINTTELPEEGALEALAQKISDNPLQLRFETGESKISLNTQQRQKFANIVSYLDKDPNATCIIEGHTDNTGTPETNRALGKERAEFAKQYLIGQGLAPKRIETVSFGSERPIAPNDTEAGRAQNRRTVINIQQ